ncbi:Bgt-50952 [Blumeria graminis f. sp. tritici]|uniref:Bgt-50952 n=1 Tax=Blumeria graminis f. sp. tritici TaxID=62690 RepID=A0A9X9LAS0_BLUGR|nr:Bgt-50952 [Blumeria graminis f. sp. tritici]
MVSMRPWISMMQDNAPAHGAASTVEETSQRLIQSISGRPIRLTSTRLKPFEIERRITSSVII